MTEKAHSSTKSSAPDQCHDQGGCDQSTTRVDKSDNSTSSPSTASDQSTSAGTRSATDGLAGWLVDVQAGETRSVLGSVLDATDSAAKSVSDILSPGIDRVVSILSGGNAKEKKD